MSLTRRNFLQSTAVAGTALCAANPIVQASETTGKSAVLKLAIQEWLVPGKNLSEKVENMKKWGFEGIEPGGGDLAKRANEFKSALKGSEIQVSAICAGFKGAPISDNLDERKKAHDTIKEILSAAGELGSPGLIIVPAFNGQTKLDHVEGRKVLLEFLHSLADHAQSAGTRILLEPLNRGEAWFLRQLHDAGAICKDVNHPAVRMMGDFYHMGIEEVCDYAAFIGVRDYVHHVHLASRPNRKQPGYDSNDDFRPGFRALKEMGYNDYCSYECGIEGKTDVEIPKMIEYIRKQWKEA